MNRNSCTQIKAKRTRKINNKIQTVKERDTSKNDCRGSATDSERYANTYQTYYQDEAYNFAEQNNEKREKDSKTERFAKAN